MKNSNQYLLNGVLLEDYVLYYGIYNIYINFEILRKMNAINSILFAELKVVLRKVIFADIGVKWIVSILITYHDSPGFGHHFIRNWCPG